MKFLVLALCVCAASAASFGSTPFGSGGYKNFKGFPKTTANAAATAANVAANVVVAPAVLAAKTAAVVATPVVAPVVTAAAATQEAGSATYQAAKSVVNKGYSDESQATVLRSDSEVNADGYNYIFETNNGISGQASGLLKQVGESGAVVSSGSYRYISPEGFPVEVTYIADENGFQPQSDFLPVGPPIPEAIARSLEYIAARTQPDAAVQKY